MFNFNPEVNKIYAQTEWLLGRDDVASPVWSTVKETLPKLTWFLSFLNPLMAIVVLLLFSPGLFNLLVKFVSSRPWLVKFVSSWPCLG